jgi:hypothetical protein
MTIALDTQTENTVINRGDINVFGNKGDERLTRRDVINADPRTIFPGEVVYKAQPSKNFEFFWHLTSKGDNEFLENEYEELLDLGFFEVVADDETGPFIVKRWRRDGAKRVISAGRLLMARDEETWEKRKAEVAGDKVLLDELEQRNAELHAMAEEIGVGTYETIRGKTRERVKAK